MTGRSIPLITSARTYVIWVACSSLLAVLLYLFLEYSANGQLPDLGEHQGRILFAIAVTNLVAFLVLQIDRILDRLLHWKHNFLLRYIAGLGADTAFVILFFALAGKYVARGEYLLKLTIIFIIIVFIYETFYGLFYSYRYYAITQAEQLRSERWQLELQFESLKSQISPHYLFNCLNTVSSLLYKDTRIAEEFIRRMADTFRYVLDHQTHKLVSLEEELNFVKAYYFLLQVRYEYHLKMEINVPHNILDTRIPPMTLQLLVENAVKHNAISKDQPLFVYISALDNTTLLVTNTKTSTIRPVSSFKVGLENIHRRYGFFSQQKVKVRDEEKFVVELPILKNNIAQATFA